VSKGFIYKPDPTDADVVNRWMDRIDTLINDGRAEIATTNAAVTAVADRVGDLEYTAIDITALTGGSSNERGVTVTTVTLNWTITGSADVASQTLTDTTILPTVRTKAFTGLTLTTNKTYTLVATDSEGGTDTATASVLFYDKRHWGVSASTTLDSAAILALASNELGTARTQSRTFDCTGGRYIFFAWPASWGTPTFTVNGLVDSSWVNATVSHTNASGAVVSYHTWRSLNLLNGSSVTVVVT